MSIRNRTIRGGTQKLDNTMKWRREPALFLHLAGNAQGGTYFMKISNGERVLQNKVGVMPIPEDVVEKIHQLAKQQKFLKEGLGFCNRRR